MAFKNYYKFNGTFNDEISPLNNLTPNGMSTAISFEDGAVKNFSLNDYLTSSARTINDFIPNEIYTIEMYVKFVTGSNDQHIFSLEGNQLHFRFSVENNNLMQFKALNNQFTYNDAVAFTDDGLFHHIAVVSTGTVFRTFIDGVELLGNGSPSNQTFHLPTAYNGQASTLVIGRDFAGAIDDVKISDTALYSANFTPAPREGGALVGEKIKSKITVGGKLILSLNSSPITDGGVDAPIGSQALVNISGQGSTWIKSGPTLIDWLRVATGISEDGWNMVYNINDLDEPVADAFFGSNANAFNGNISLVRKGNIMLVMKTDNSLFTTRKTVFSNTAEDRSISVEEGTLYFNRTQGSGIPSSINKGAYVLQVRAGEGNDLDLNGHVIFSFNDDNEDGEFQEIAPYPMLGLQPNVVRAIRPYVAIAVDNNETVIDFPRIYNNVVEEGGVNMMSEIESTIMIKGLVDGQPAHMMQKIICHMVEDTLIFQQDLFFNQTPNAQVADIRCSLEQVGDTFNYKFKTLEAGKELTNGVVVIFQTEKMI